MQGNPSSRRVTEPVTGEQQYTVSSKLGAPRHTPSTHVSWSVQAFPSSHRPAPHRASASSRIFGKKTWNKLPKDIQDIFIDQGKKTHAEYLAWLTGFEASAVENIKKTGGVFKDFPASELAKWKALAPKYLDAWEADVTKRGYGEQAKKIAARWRELMAE